MAIPMLKIRRPLGRLIFNMGIAIPGKTVFLIETAPWWLSIINSLIVVRQMPLREDLANPTNGEKYHLMSAEIQTRSSPIHFRIPKHFLSTIVKTAKDLGLNKITYSHHVADNIFKCIFLKEKLCIWFKFWWNLLRKIQLIINWHWFM